jgi:nicotinamide mononucleotide (NMN) deamidase PncC
VWFAWARRGRATVAASRMLEGGRTAIREASVAIALEGLLGLVADQS